MTSVWPWMSCLLRRSRLCRPGSRYATCLTGFLGCNDQSTLQGVFEVSGVHLTTRLAATMLAHSATCLYKKGFFDV